MVTKPLIGIDLGTTFSLVSAMQNGKPILLPNALGDTLTPSAVSIGEDGVVHVGAAAKARQATHPEATAVAFKRDMGTEQKYSLSGKVFTPQMLSSFVLAALKADAEAALGCPIEEAVITVPAYFGDLQRTATREAATLAGLNAERIINEPTAAALAYGLGARDRELTAVVLDLGGGTFDVSVLQIMEGVIEIRASSGDARLGGEDFDAALATLIAKRHNLEAKANAKVWARLLVACDDAKRRLTENDSCRVVLPDWANRSLSEEITRADAEAAWQPLLDRMRGPVSRALSDARLRADQIDEVLVVGGATRIPCVRSLAAKIFGRLPLLQLPPDEAVALGAAVQAALKANDASVDDVVVTDIAPFSIGMATGQRYGQHIVDNLFTPFIERGTVIPCSRVQMMAPLHDAQKYIEVKVYQGEHSDCDRNQLLGTYKLDLPARAREDNNVAVRFTCDLNGILEIEMTPVATSRAEAFVIEQRPGNMTKPELAAALKQLKSLKINPRDKLPNATALARADALHQELIGDRRAMLAEEVARFHAALAGQDEKQIDAARERLVAATSHLRQG